MISRSMVAIGVFMHTFFVVGQGSEGISAYGVLRDSNDKSEVVGATIHFKNVKDTTRSRYSVSAVDGTFEVKHLEAAFYRLSIRSLGYETYTQMLRIGSTGADLGTITLLPDTKVLSEVEVKGAVVPIEQKGDTTVYHADAFQVNPDASTKDLVSKMPGIVVDDEGVTANGETVQQVLLDGKRFFGQDPLLSLNTIPAEVVKRVEVFDQLSEQSQLTGFDDGNTTKTMNVVTREDKRNGVFGKLYAGYGTDNLYHAGGNLNAFKRDFRLTVIGMSNNINQQNFSNEDIAGVSGSRGGFRGRPGQGNSGFFTGVQSGITDTNSLGTNLTDSWGEKTTFEGSYFLNNTSNSNAEQSDRETYLADATQYYEEDVQSTTDNENHRFNSRITYSINDKDKLIVRPSFSYQNNRSEHHTLGLTTTEADGILNRTDNDYQSENVAYNLENQLLYQHKFDKVGRSVSMGLTTKLHDVDRNSVFVDLAADSTIEYYTDEKVLNLQSNVTYTEPVGSTAQFSAGYHLGHQSRTSDKRAYTSQADSDRSFASSLSNELASGYTTHSPSIHLANRAFSKMFDFGLVYQYATLNNDEQFPSENTHSKHFHSLLPLVMGRIAFAGGGDVFLRYATSTEEPSIDQLQHVIDNSSPLFLTIGNLSLNQSYSHSLMIRFAKANVDKNRSFSNLLRLEMASNYITNSTYVVSGDSTLAEGVVAQSGAQISRPVNMDGYWQVSNHATHSTLISAIGSNLNTSVGLSYTRLPGETNRLRNFANTYSANGRLALVSHINANVDFNIYYDANGSLVKNSIQTENSSSSYMRQTLGGQLNLIFWKGFVFRSDISYQRYNGVSESSDLSYTLWNMSLGKKFLKNNAGEVEVSVFDVLSQNQSINQTVGSSYIEETRTRVLRQYFMLKLTYQLRKFG